ncbi:MAG: TRAP transporter small permease subunit [Burkholderiaceae bacterium]
MRAYIAFMDRLSDALAVIAGVMLFIAVVVLCWMVAYRTMGYSTSWELELGVFMMVCSLFLACPYTLKTNGHVGVDLLATYLAPGAARTLSLFTMSIGLLVVLFLAIKGWDLTAHAFIKGERTESVWAPYKWPLFATMPIGLGITVAQYIAEIGRLLGATSEQTEARA